MVERLGWVGFGEAAYCITKGLKEAGLREVFAFDINAQSAKLGAKIQNRAAEAGTVLVESNAALADKCDVILAAVTADQALNATNQTAPHLNAKHVYADLNSISPQMKEAIAKAVDARGARFVEIAVMGPVPPYRQKVPMLLGGVAAPEFKAMFEPMGMQMEIVSTDRIGRAAAVKMFRSVIYKGLEALIFECVLGASQYGAEPRVFESLNESFPGLDFQKLADYMVGRVVVHGERRAREMEEVAATLKGLGIEPMMAEATVRRMDWAANLGLKEKFGGEFPKTYREVLDAISEGTALSPG
jgi:3-hydroxyisobutyrate dehydrogenase-like beta-hydroxyacid dehydrogenase